MTETQAKSGAAGTPSDPSEQEAADGGTAPAGRAVVGRAAVPGESSPPKFSRPPGMAPPPGPGEATAPADGRGAGAGQSRTGRATVVTSAPPAMGSGAPTAAAAPTSGAAAGATATGAAPVPPGVRPTGPGQPATTGLGVRGVGAARVTEAVRAARATVSAAARGPRRARLTIKRLDPWSVMKFSFFVSLVLFVVLMVATAVLYLALDAMGVFNSINDSLAEMVNAGSSSGDTFRVTAKGVLGTAALIGAVNVVLFTALATLAAFIYNVCADLVGGIELTLSERD
jgi:Transmembrane domain of unknown function (DUF3566)